jgi:hypothetical protein
MKDSAFLRNSRASDVLEIFLISAITSLLVVRLYLHLTNYPQVGGGSFHVAHMLYGGLFMLAAIVLLLSFIGRRIERASAVLGGIGFGVFIDELGKFITKDNNYFFQPTVSLIYIIFVVLFLIFRALGREQGFSEREYLLNGLLQLEEAVLHDMDESERQHTLSLLSKADQNNGLTIQLTQIVTNLKPEKATHRNQSNQLFHRIRSWYDSVIGSHTVRLVIVTFFIADGIYLITSILYNINYGDIDNYHFTTLAQLISTGISGVLVAVGIIHLRSSRLIAYEYFSRALLVTLFITEFFSFYRVQFDALGGFFINLLALIALRYALSEERRLLRNTQLKK